MLSSASDPAGRPADEGPPWVDRGGALPEASRSMRDRGRLACLVLAVAALVVSSSVAGGCAHQPPSRPVAAEPPVEGPAAVLAPLPRACQEVLPLGDRGGAAGRSVGELVRLLRRINPRLELADRECAAGDS